MESWTLAHKASVKPAPYQIILGDYSGDDVEGYLESSNAYLRDGFFFKSSERE